VLALPKARVPIVKFTAPNTTLHCDLGINNLLAVENSQLLRDYTHIDERFRELCYLVKHWAKMRKVNDPYRGTLSSYAYVLMILHYLQTIEPAVLPCLQSVARQQKLPEHVVQGFDCSYYRDINALKGFGTANKLSLAQLLHGFFRLYAKEFDYRQHVISVRTGMYLDKVAKKWNDSKGRDRHWVSIEDPFEVTHDLGRVCDKPALHHVRGELMRAHRILSTSGNWAETCEPSAKDFRGS